jgi:hypothetical protein
MQVSVEIPDELVPSLTKNGEDLARVILEAIALEGYRSGSLTPRQTRELLGFEISYQLDGFLKAHNVQEGAYDLKDYEQDCKTVAVLEEKRRLERPKYTIEELTRGAKPRQRITKEEREWLDAPRVGRELL